MVKSCLGVAEDGDRAVSSKAGWTFSTGGLSAQLTLSSTSILSPIVKASSAY